MEEWKYYATYYIRSKKHDLYVSNYGNVKDNGKLKLNPTKVNGVRIYIVVAELFVPNPENKPVVDHIDTNRKNNRADNLRWVTNSENMQNDLTRQHCREAMYKRIEAGVYKHTPEKLKGREPWNKGMKGYIRGPHSEETKSKIGNANKNRHKVWDNKELNLYHMEK